MAMLAIPGCENQVLPIFLVTLLYVSYPMSVMFSYCLIGNTSWGNPLNDTTSLNRCPFGCRLRLVFIFAKSQSADPILLKCVSEYLR